MRCLRRVLREHLDDDARGRLLIAAVAAESRVVTASAGLPYLRTAVELEADARALAASALDLGRALPEGAERAELATLLPTIAGRLDDDDHGTEEFRLRLELAAAAEQPLPDAAGARIVEDLLGGRRKGANRLERQALAQLAAVHANDAHRWNADAVAELAQQLVDTDNLAVADPTEVRLWARALTTLARTGRLAPAATLTRQAQAVATAHGEESAFLELTSVLAYVYLLQGSLELAEEECRRVRTHDDGPGAADTLGRVGGRPTGSSRPGRSPPGTRSARGGPSASRGWADSTNRPRPRHAGAPGQVARRGGSLGGRALGPP